MGDLNVYNDIVWVKIVYPDKSTYIFRGTCCKDICESIGIDLPNSDFILDVSKRKAVCICDCDVSYYVTKPEYERRVDDFASRFV